MRGIVLLAGASGDSYGSGVIDNLRADTIATAVPRTQKSPAYAGLALQSSIKKKNSRNLIVSCSLLMFPCLYGLALCSLSTVRYQIILGTLTVNPRCIRGICMTNSDCLSITRDGGLVRGESSRLFFCSLLSLDLDDSLGFHTRIIRLAFGYGGFRIHPSPTRKKRTTNNYHPRAGHPKCRSFFFFVHLLNASMVALPET